MDQKRRSQNIKTVDLEVQVKKGSRGTETITNTKKHESIPLENLAQNNGASNEVGEHHHVVRDISSGYSSTDRSSSQGSAERLIVFEERKL